VEERGAALDARSLPAATPAHPRPRAQLTVTAAHPSARAASKLSSNGRPSSESGAGAETAPERRISNGGARRTPKASALTAVGAGRTPNSTPGSTETSKRGHGREGAGDAGGAGSAGSAGAGGGDVGGWTGFIPSDSRTVASRANA